MSTSRPKFTTMHQKIILLVLFCCILLFCGYFSLEYYQYDSRIPISNVNSSQIDGFAYMHDIQTSRDRTPKLDNHNHEHIDFDRQQQTPNLQQYDYDDEQPLQITLSNISFETCTQIIDNHKLHLFNTSSSDNECHRKFKYCGDSVPFLFSFGGSGNTVTRIIISYITNIYTGSIYPATTRMRSKKLGRMTGEGHCSNDNDTLIIKAHPEHLNGTKLRALLQGKCSKFHCLCGEKKRGQRKEISDDVLYEKNPFYDSYSLINDIRNIRNVIHGIFIVRNPWHSMWTLYQLNFGTGCEENRDQMFHVRHVYTKSTKRCPVQFEKIWNRETFARNLLNGIVSYKQWLKTFELMELLDQYKQTYTVIRYENMFNLKEPKIAIAEINKMIEYLYSEEHYAENKHYLLSKMECLVRRLIVSDWGRFKAVHRLKADKAKHQMTVQEAYDQVNNSVVCEVWRGIRRYATRYNYVIWRPIVGC